jgi:hypothetical protein
MHPKETGPVDSEKEEKEEAKERTKKPYSPPELTKFGPVEELTGPVPS